MSESQQVMGCVLRCWKGVLMEMTTGEPAPFSQGCGACGMGCWQDLLLHKARGTEQAKCRQPEGWAGGCAV